jgi:predicted Holliday junction resolvase-like endonuclease
MENLLTIAFIAVAFLFLGFLLGKGNQRKESVKEIKKALEGQRVGIKGKVAENIAPLLPDFQQQFPDLNIADARFIGEPIDYLFFEGMSEGRINKITFLEVKSGKHPRLNDHENSLKEVVRDAESKGAGLEWHVYRVQQSEE